jgi:Cu/Ag efflux protein CusF
VAADAFARANHTGTQTASTISDFDAEVSNNTTVAAKADQSTTYTIGQVDSMLTYYPLSANTYTKIEVDANIAANFTPAQAAEIAANTLKTGITTAQADEIAANTLKVTYPSADSSKLAGIATGAEVNTIDSAVAGEPSGSDLVLNVVSLTQAEYDAGTPVATTFYIIT